MPKVARELSALAVQKLKTKGLHAVGGVAGLYLSINPPHAKSWIVRLVIDGRRREIGLGSFADVTLAQARQKARIARQAVAEGLLPVTIERKAPVAAHTFAACAEAYIASHRAGWKNPKHAAQWTSTLSTYACPVIGSMPVDQIDQSHVLSVLEPIWSAKTETATRVRGRIESILDWATVMGHRKGDNPARWKGHLDHLLPAPSKIAKVQHHRALPIDAMPSFMLALGQREGLAVRALEFAILTAARSGEVRGAVWAEMDLHTAVWTIPASRMKAGREHRVPLSDAAVGLLLALPRIEGTDLLFPGMKNQPLSDMSPSAVLRRMEIDAVPHGFRSTFRDWAGDRTSYPRDLIEQALAHTLESRTEAAYRRSDALEKRRALMQEWGLFLAGN